MAPAKLPVWFATLVLFALTSAVPATASLPGGTFFDDDGSVHEGAIEAVAAAGITVGCDELGERFCPDRAVTRAEIATFLVRALGVAPRDPVRFVDAAGVHRGSIGAAEAAGWFKGCNPPANDMFCPDEALTRGQAAAVLVRAFGLPEVAGPGFVDVGGSVFADAIGRLAAAGVTKGCNPPANDRFCPDRAVTRGEMATFLARLLGLETVTVESPFEGRIVLGLWNGLVAYGGIASMEGTRIPDPLIIDTVGDPVMSPDSETIAYVDIRRECPPDAMAWWDCYNRIFTMPIGGGAETQMTPNEVGVWDFAWAPDSESISLIEAWARGADDTPTEWDLARVSAAAPLVVERIAGPWTRPVDNLEISSVGDIALTAEQTSSDVGLLVLDTSGDQKTLIASAGRDITYPAWSPDGLRLAYVVDGDEDQLVVCSPDGTQGVVVATTDEIRRPAWSPDGTELAYVVVEGENAQVVVVAANGGVPSILSTGYDIWNVVWSPDGSVVAFNVGFRAWAVRVSGGDPWPLTPEDIPIYSIDWGPAPG